jgi:hypothetical protein
MSSLVGKQPSAIFAKGKARVDFQILLRSPFRPAELLNLLGRRLPQGRRVAIAVTAPLLRSAALRAQLYSSDTIASWLHANRILSWDALARKNLRHRRLRE